MKATIQRWFMPWRWGRWLWAGSAVLIVGMLATPVPIERALDSIHTPQSLLAVTDTIYAPAWWCADRSDTVMHFYCWQDSRLTDVLGPPKNYAKCGIWLNLTLLTPVSQRGPVFGFFVIDEDDIQTGVDLE